MVAEVKLLPPKFLIVTETGTLIPGCTGDTGVLIATTPASFAGMLYNLKSSIAISLVKLVPLIPRKRIWIVPVWPAKLTVLLSHGSEATVCCGPVIVAKVVQVVPLLFVTCTSSDPMVAPFIWYQKSKPGVVRPEIVKQGETRNASSPVEPEELSV